jgi:hypothetical protein
VEFGKGNFAILQIVPEEKKFELISDWVGPNWQPDQRAVRSLSMTAGPAY